MKKFILTIIYLKILIIKSQTCGVTDPKSIDDCIESSSTNSVCCFLSIKTKEDSQNKSDTLCIFVPKSQIFITPHITSLDLGSNEEDISISLDCGFDPIKLKQGEPYSYCGENPKEPFDCINNSTRNASCCYIKNSNGNSFCVLNNGVYKNNKTYFGVNIICNSNYLEMNVLKIIFFIIFTFFIYK